MATYYHTFVGARPGSSEEQCRYGLADSPTPGDGDEGNTADYKAIYYQDNKRLRTTGTGAAPLADPYQCFRFYVPEVTAPPHTVTAYVRGYANNPDLGVIYYTGSWDFVLATWETVVNNPTGSILTLEWNIVNPLDHIDANDFLWLYVIAADINGNPTSIYTDCVWLKTEAGGAGQGFPNPEYPLPPFHGHKPPGTGGGGSESGRHKNVSAHVAKWMGGGWNYPWA